MSKNGSQYTASAKVLIIKQPATWRQNHNNPDKKIY